MRIRQVSCSGHQASSTVTTSAELRVEGRGPFPYQVDGDDLGDIEHLDIDYEPDALTVVLP